MREAGSFPATMAPKRQSSDKQWPLPLLQGLLPLDKFRLGPDIVAGITLAALGILR